MIYQYSNDLTQSERSWPEDYTHENGNYTNICCQCSLHFVGHKRRVVCKKCTNQVPKQSFAELLHNLVAHPLLAICNALHLYKLGSWIHDDIFKF